MVSKAVFSNCSFTTTTKRERDTLLLAKLLMSSWVVIKAWSGVFFLHALGISTYFCLFIIFKRSVQIKGRGAFPNTDIYFGYKYFFKTLKIFKTKNVNQSCFLLQRRSCGIHFHWRLAKLWTRAFSKSIERPSICFAYLISKVNWEE